MTDGPLLVAAGVGAGMVLVSVVIPLAVVWLIVHRHEGREETKDAARHQAITDLLSDQKKLTLLAIAGRTELERRVHDSEERLELHSGRIEELRERLGLKAES